MSSAPISTIPMVTRRYPRHALRSRRQSRQEEQDPELACYLWDRRVLHPPDVCGCVTRVGGAPHRSADAWSAYERRLDMYLNGLLFKYKRSSKWRPFVSHQEKSHNWTNMEIFKYEKYENMKMWNIFSQTFHETFSNYVKFYSNDIRLIHIYIYIRTCFEITNRVYRISSAN